MKILGAEITLTVTDPTESSRFFCTHLGFRESMAGAEFVCLERDDADVTIVLARRDPEMPPPVAGPGPTGVLVSFDVADLAAEQHRLLDEGAALAAPLHREPAGRWLLRLTDPNRVEVQLTQWAPPAGL
ncbi:glyoxalase [Nocardia yunnanensis]|uniref:Glyoxalase n=1 Tax=Nocardia yunnanensis TaxID=2382165 RepID=A0A386Z6T0_9NOCA|nr:VOC family protein [Nocardia yunnanensis]AYF72817.1 glyoxalase [Nocardia yunnanensis]